MPKIDLYKNEVKGNKKVLRDIVREIYENYCKNKPNKSLKVIANFNKRSSEDGIVVFDLSLESEGVCSTYVLEVKKSRNGLYKKEDYTMVKR